MSGLLCSYRFYILMSISRSASCIMQWNKSLTNPPELTIKIRNVPRASLPINRLPELESYTDPNAGSAPIYSASTDSVSFDGGEVYSTREQSCLLSGLPDWISRIQPSLLLREVHPVRDNNGHGAKSNLIWKWINKLVNYLNCNLSVVCSGLVGRSGFEPCSGLGSFSSMLIWSAPVCVGFLGVLWFSPTI